MSTNIKISEGGITRGFTADKLRVPLEAGGYELLVPESAVGLGELRATVNRRYRPGEDGLFAYSVVKADVPEGRSVTGKGPDGKKYKVSIDEDGNIVETPEGTGDIARIAVTTPPAYTGPYGDRAYISFEGLVVTAYDANGNSLGTIPNDELVFPVTVTHYDSSVATGYAINNDVDPNTVMFTHGPISGISGDYSETISVTGESPVYIVPYGNEGNNNYAYALSLSPITETLDGLVRDSIYHYEYTLDNTGTTVGGNRYYWDGLRRINVPLGQMISFSGYPENAVSKIGQILFDGETHDTGNQLVPVQYVCSDGRTLEATFGITVVSIGGGGSGEDDNPIVNP